MSYKIKRTKGDIIFDAVNIIILIFIGILTVYPFLRIIAVSLSSPYALTGYPMSIIPKNFTLMSYASILKDGKIMLAFKNSVLITVIGTLADVILTVMLAYPLSKKRLPFRNFFTMFCVFTMFFGAGLIPNYLLVKNLGLINNYLVLIIPRLINTYNMLICRNFFMSISPEIEESASIDGANDITILRKLIVPISKPIIVTLILWYGVSRWNSYFDCLIYITEPKKRVLSVVLREFITMGTNDRAKGDKDSVFNVDLVRSSTMVLSMIPILVVYPFLQKYFVKGIMVGSLKG
jgi:putative aldouronate transport system permease protein